MKSIHVIINPAAGKGMPVLTTLNDAFGDRVKWDVSITHGPGEARQHARQALADGVDIVAVCGGDGTVSEVASAMARHAAPMAILPGGTGNGVARFLNLPLDLHHAAALLTSDFEVRPIDLGRVNEHTFMLRADLGFMEATDAATTRVSKGHLGKWAYALSSIRQRNLLGAATHYALEIDGNDVEIEAVTILVVNIGAVAFGRKALVHDLAPDDSYLDLLILTRRDTVALAEVASSVVLGNRTPMLHWRMKKVVIHTNPKQRLALDGEVVEDTPAVIEVQPHAVNVVVPRMNAALPMSNLQR